MTDTLIHTVNTYQGESLPIFFHNESWIAASILAIFAIMIFAHANSNHLVALGLKQLFKRHERTESYMKSTFRDFLSRILYIVSTTLIVSLAIYTNLADTANISISSFLLTSLATLLFISVKYSIVKVLGYIFITKEKTQLCVTTLFNLLMVAGIVLLPVLTLKIYFLDGNSETFFNVFMLILVIFWHLILTLKTFQFFYKNIVDFVYILLYLCTLEIIPLALMYQVYKLFI